uniref:Ig-like domain-containing protein n=1 Tax=Neogobius melanostomus TaxID=47308 RepID=A0A8C6TR54_9GOBI
NQSGKVMLIFISQSESSSHNFIILPVPASIQNLYSTTAVRMETLKIVVITVLCSLKYNSRVWYKLGSNRRLQLLASTNVLFTPNAPIDDHYKVNSSKNENILTIKDMTVKDVGTYFCGISNINDVLFGSGTVLEIEGESEPVQSVLQSPEYFSAKPGDSVTLSCSFTSRLCPQEHTSAVWVRSGSASSEIVSSDHGKKIFCESSSCVHNLTLKNITEDGTYLCMVTACGDTLIGNVTRIRLDDSIIIKDFYLSTNMSLNKNGHTAQLYDNVFPDHYFV